MPNGATEERVGGRAAAPRRRAAAAAARRPHRLRVVATVAADAVAVAVSAVVATWLVSAHGDGWLLDRLAGWAGEATGATGLAFVALTPFWLALLWAFGLYREPGRSIGGANVAEALSGLTALTVAAWALLALMLLVAGREAPVAALVAQWAVAAATVPLARLLVRLTVWARPAFVERVLIIGAGEVGHTVARKLGAHPEYRVHVVGFLDDGEPRGAPDGSPMLPLLGSLADLPRVVDEQQVDRVIVAFSRARHNDLLRVVRACADRAVKVNIVPRLFEVVSSRALVDDIEGIPLLDVGHVELSRFNMAVKRAFDLVVGSLLFVLVLPLFAAIAIAIKLDSPGPVFYRQERMGRGRRVFRIYKFRSMHAGADAERPLLADRNEYSGPMFKIRDDPRMTRVGRWLRRWSLDELPQLLNVLKGDMSLVGPRPLWVVEAEQCRGWTQKRLDITPGMTGLWQVLGRSAIPFDEMVKLDYMYVTGWSLAWDVKLLLQTIPAVLSRRGAY